MAALLVPALLFGNVASAQDDTQELAKKLSNPIASLISVPFQFNYDSGGPNDGNKVFVNVQPVIPITLNDNWNLISRTILPIVWQEDIAGPTGDQFGLGDITQSLFFSPAKPTGNGIIWGVGRRSCSRPLPTICSEERSGEPDQQPSSSSNSMDGRWACWPITSGRSPATTIAAISVRPSCSPSSPTRPRTHGRSR
jgi:hypothetical protein